MLDSFARLCLKWLSCRCCCYFITCRVTPQSTVQQWRLAQQLAAAYGTVYFAQIVTCMLLLLLLQCSCAE
jgi:hypothetical protein